MPHFFSNRCKPLTLSCFLRMGAWRRHHPSLFLQAFQVVAQFNAIGVLDLVVYRAPLAIFTPPTHRGCCLTLVLGGFTSQHGCEPNMAISFGGMRLLSQTAMIDTFSDLCSFQMRIDTFSNRFTKNADSLRTCTTTRIKFSTCTCTQAFRTDLTRWHQEMHMMIALIPLLIGLMDCNKHRNLIAVNQHLTQIARERTTLRFVQFCRQSNFKLSRRPGV